MSDFNAEIREYFTIEGQDPYEVQNNSLNADVMEQEIARGKKTDGFALNVLQNRTFVKDARQYLLSDFYKNGLKSALKYTLYRRNFDDFIEESEKYVDYKTIDVSKTKLTLDFSETSFETVLESNLSEEFELNRTTDINGNTIPDLETHLSAHKSREIFLRSELENSTTDPYVFSGGAISPPFQTVVVSDPSVLTTSPNTDGFFGVPFDFSQSEYYPQNQQFFYQRADRPKTLKIGVKANFTWTFANNAADTQIIEIYIQKGKYIEGEDRVEPVETYFYTSVEGDYTYDEQEFTIDFEENPLSIDLDTDECLCFRYGAVTDLSFTHTYTRINESIIVTEDSYYVEDLIEDRSYDCVTLYEAFERVTEILDPNVTFKSDFIRTNWNNMILFSGETARHVLYDENKPPVATVSFQQLYDFINTITPVAFGVRKQGVQTILEVEEIDYFFDNEEAIDLGEISSYKITSNNTRVYSSIKVGYTKSGDNEEVFGLQAVHTVNTFKLPADGGNTYEITSDFRTSPEELEMCYRKQYRRYPDEDTKYDKDIFAVDCFINSEGYYQAYGYDTHYVDISGIYSPDTFYNARLTPLQCVLRHGKGFMQEYVKQGYSGGQILYQNTKGNVELALQISGDTLRKENSNIPFTAVDAPLYTSHLISGTASFSRDKLDQINGGLTKQNYYKTVVFKIDGEQQRGFVSSLKITDKIEVELYEKYGK